MAHRVLITGIDGFVGSHLAERLAGGGSEVFGTVLGGPSSNLEGISGIRPLRCDLLDAALTLESVKEAHPHVIYHLAAQSNPSASLKDPGSTLKINIFTTLNLLEAAAKAAPDAVIIFAGSGDEYGEVESPDLPVKETVELRPLNPYSVSKVGADMLAYQYFKSKGLKVVRCRPFNHFGARQADNFVTASFARQIAEIEAGHRQEPRMIVGNLEAAKDFLDVRDVVEAYELLSNKGAYGGVYNICSGEAVKISGILDRLLFFSERRIEVVQDSSRLRKNEAMAVYGDCSKLKALGWTRRITLEQGLRDLLEFWREKVRKGGLKA